MLGIAEGELQKALVEPLKYVWILQRMYHACVVKSDIIYRAHGNAVDCSYMNSKQAETIFEDSDLTEDGIELELKKNYAVTFTVFPGFYLDNSVVAKCQVAIHLKDEAGQSTA